MTRIPEKGLPPDALLSLMKDMRQGDVAWKDGRMWSLIYYVDEAHHQFQKEVYGSFLTENYLNPFAFQSLRHMEREVVEICAGLFHGPETAVGTMTTGGTESIFLAMYAYRERAGRKRNPQVVVPATIHPAFDKAAHILGLHLHKVAVDPQTRQPDPDDFRRAINRRTIALAASAPNYPYGILDPLEAISDIALEHHLPLHVDSCVGGFMLPWLDQVPAWDFRLPGVTSISADLHKFGFAAKGASVVLYRSMDYLRRQFFLTTDWPGGIYVSPTLLGSRSGGPIATAWAVLHKMGADGYRQQAARIMEGFAQLKTGLENLGLKIMGNPVMNILAYYTPDNRPDIFVVADYLTRKGWVVDRQQHPPCIHQGVLPNNIASIPAYLADLGEALEYARQNPQAEAEGNAALYGLMARLPLRGMVDKNVRQVMENLYGNTNDSPEPAPWMGKLNRLLKGMGR